MSVGLLAAENGAVSVARLKELRLRYIDGMRDLMPPEALNATWLVDKVGGWVLCSASLYCCCMHIGTGV